jgi:hypothetical protein
MPRGITNTKSPISKHNSTLLLPPTKKIHTQKNPNYFYPFRSFLIPKEIAEFTIVNFQMGWW